MVNITQVYDPQVINIYEEAIRTNLQKLGLKLDWLKESHILSIGSGRESIALISLGIKKVSHFDIYIHNVKRLISYMSQHNLEKN